MSSPPPSSNPGQIVEIDLCNDLSSDTDSPEHQSSKISSTLINENRPTVIQSISSPLKDPLGPSTSDSAAASRSKLPEIIDLNSDNDSSDDSQSVMNISNEDRPSVIVDQSLQSAVVVDHPNESNDEGDSSSAGTSSAAKVQSLKCPFCNKTCKNLASLRTHKKKHTMNFLRDCTVPGCGKRCRTQRDRL